MKNSEIPCYQKIAEAKTSCPQKDCRHFLKSDKDLNCSIIAANAGPKTLQEIGDYYGISRMRICQIEKAILKKLKSDSKKINSFGPLPREKT